MKASEFVMLLKGVDPKTPLGRIVEIRAETDRDIIKEFTPQQRKIHSDWRRRMAGQVSEKEMKMVLDGLRDAFVAMSGTEKGKKDV